MELAAVCLLHACCSNNSNVDWSALEGTRMRLIRPLLNILRHRHPLSLKVTAAHVLQRLARSQVCVGVCMCVGACGCVVDALVDEDR